MNVWLGALVVLSVHTVEIPPLPMINHTKAQKCQREKDQQYHFLESTTARIVTCTVAKRENAAALHSIVKTLYQSHVDIALYFFDNSTEWLKRTNNSWIKYVTYMSDVDRQRNKWLTCIKNTPLNFGFYSHLWMVDPDIIFPDSAEVQRIIRSVYTYQAPISQPTVSNSDHIFVHRSKKCTVRSTNFVEIQIPIIRVSVLPHLLPLFPDKHTLDWGIDMVWCQFVKSIFWVRDACVVINSNFKHPKRRYTSKNRSYSISEGKATEKCMFTLFPSHWVTKQVTFSCLLK